LNADHIKADLENLVLFQINTIDLAGVKFARRFTKADKKAIFTAASKASEAVTFLASLQGA
jgi:antirestriction protein ArdC